MRYLIDTNVWLERLLDQTRSREVGELLRRVPPTLLGMTDFALHSIGVVLSRLKRPDILPLFVEDVLARGLVSVVRREPDDLARVVAAIARFRLDFDDAYQYVAAEKHGLTLVSFDADFDRTERGRTDPASVRPE